MVKVTYLKAAVHRADSDAMSDDATIIEIVDEGAGAYVTLTQSDGTVRIDPSELATVFRTAKRMLSSVSRDL